jgi:hypothetical protein
MGNQDQKFAESANTLVGSDQGFPRYEKRFNAKGGRKFGRFRIEAGRRTRGNQFSGSVAGGTHRSD